jgi:hypothetical protein
MKKLIKFSFLIAILAIAVTSCNQSKNKSTDNDVAGGIFTVAEKAALKIKVADEMILFYTHDTKNQRLRMDVPEAIMLMDYKNKTLQVYAGMWMTIPWETNSGVDDYFDKMSEEGIAEQGYVKTGTMTDLGKVCDLYSKVDPTTNVETKFAIWNGVTLWIEEDGKVIYEALAVTLDVPDNFFEQSTLDHPWIE